MPLSSKYIRSNKLLRPTADFMSKAHSIAKKLLDITVSQNEKTS